jgi:hypothetical protein
MAKFGFKDKREKSTLLSEIDFLRRVHDTQLFEYIVGLFKRKYANSKKEFIDYFEKTYLKKPFDTWNYCKLSHTNIMMTNNTCESFNRIIKDEITDRERKSIMNTIVSFKDYIRLIRNENVKVDISMIIQDNYYVDGDLLRDKKLFYESKKYPDTFYIDVKEEVKLKNKVIDEIERMSISDLDSFKKTYDCVNVLQRTGEIYKCHCYTGFLRGYCRHSIALLIDQCDGPKILFLEAKGKRGRKRKVGNALLVDNDMPKGKGVKRKKPVIR